MWVHNCRGGVTHICRRCVFVLTEVIHICRLCAFVLMHIYVVLV